MMAERGLDGVTVSDVARRARVNRGTAYQHFPSRDHLVTAVLDRVARDTKASINARVPPTVSERIDHAIDYFATRPDVVRLTMYRMLAGVPDPRDDLWAGFVARIGRLAEHAGSRDGIDHEMLAVILIGATMFWSLQVSSTTRTAATSRRFARELKRLLLYGVLRPEVHRDVVAAVGGASRKRERRSTRNGKLPLRHVPPPRRRAGAAPRV
jgi:AcrR family transcriptional regulator